MYDYILQVHLQQIQIPNQITIPIMTTIIMTNMKKFDQKTQNNMI